VDALPNVRFRFARHLHFPHDPACEQQFSDFVKREIAPRSVLFSRNARRFKRPDVDVWCAAVGPSQFVKNEAALGLREARIWLYEAELIY
jgi:hypothetical protein